MFVILSQHEHTFLNRPAINKINISLITVEIKLVNFKQEYYLNCSSIVIQYKYVFEQFESTPWLM